MILFKCTAVHVTHLNAFSGFPIETVFLQRDSQDSLSHSLLLLHGSYFQGHENADPQKPPLSKPGTLHKCSLCLECPLSLSVFETLIICHTLSFVKPSRITYRGIKDSAVSWGETRQYLVLSYSSLCGCFLVSACFMVDSVVPVKQMNERMNDKLIGPAKSLCEQE